MDNVDQLLRDAWTLISLARQADRRHDPDWQAKREDFRRRLYDHFGIGDRFGDKDDSDAFDASDG